jgi:peptide/nickel transport system permease protein
VIAVIRFELLIDLIELWFNYFLFTIRDFKTALQIIDFNFFDALLSIKLFILLPVLAFILHKRLKWWKEKINFSITMLLFLLFAFLFAPLITDSNPDFQKDLRVTKLLAPFSSVKVIRLKNTGDPNESEVEKFVNYKNSIIQVSYNESIILASDLLIKDNLITYTQDDLEKNISFENLKLADGKPLVTNKFFFLGTDEFGRDIFARLIYGSRISLLVGIGSVIISLLIGVSFGFIAGYKGGHIDTVLSRLSDLFLSFPIIYLVVLILALFGNSLSSVIIVLGLSGWMSLFKIVKSEVLSEKSKDYIIAAEMLGQTKRRILTREILPVIFIPVIVNIIFQFSNVVLAESALSYLSLGTGSTHPSWGAMIQSGQRYITKAWWMISFPGLILIFTLFAVNDFGKKLNEIINPGAAK